MKKNAVIVGLLVVGVAVVFAIKSKERAEGCSVNDSLPRLLELGADTCIPCKAMAPILDEMRETFAGQLEVDFIDVWKNEGVAQQYGIQSIPTQIFFDDEGNELFRHSGFFSRKNILAKWVELGFVFKEQE